MLDAAQLNDTSFEKLGVARKSIITSFFPLPNHRSDQSIPV
jgi:hypothetical protein